MKINNKSYDGVAKFFDFFRAGDMRRWGPDQRALFKNLKGLNSSLKHPRRLILQAGNPRDRFTGKISRYSLIYSQSNLLLI